MYATKGKQSEQKKLGFCFFLTSCTCQILLILSAFFLTFAWHFFCIQKSDTWWQQLRSSVILRSTPLHRHSGQQSMHQPHRHGIFLHANEAHKTNFCSTRNKRTKNTSRLCCCCINGSCSSIPRDVAYIIFGTSSVASPQSTLR